MKLLFKPKCEHGPASLTLIAEGDSEEKSLEIWREAAKRGGFALCVTANKSGDVVLNGVAGAVDVVNQVAAMMEMVLEARTEAFRGGLPSVISTSALDPNLN